MVAITIHVAPATLERARALAESEGRSVDDVIGEIANDALEQELEEDITPEWRAELIRRIEGITNGTEKTLPASEAFAAIRARFAR